MLPRYSLLLDRMNWCARWTETIRQNATCPKFVKREELYRMQIPNISVLATNRWTNSNLESSRAAV